MSFLVSLLLLLHCFTSAGQKKPEEGGKQSFNNAPHSGQYNSKDNRRHREEYRLVLLLDKIRKSKKRGGNNALTMLHTVHNSNDNRRHREGYILVLLQYKVSKRDNALTMLHTVDNTVAMTKGDTGRDTD